MMMMVLIALISSLASALPSLRILPLGDSITKGSGSKDQKGYRNRLREKLIGRGTSVDMATGANFASSFSLNPGVIIADHNVGVKYAAGEGPPIDEETTALTHIQQWSDAVWMQWDRVCSESGGDVKDLKYIIRAQIVNHGTLKIVFQAILNKYERDHKKKSLGPWKKRIVVSHQKDPKELYAILGSPNGSGAAFMLINHKKRLGGARVINKVEIFVPEGNFEVGREQEEWHVMLLFHIVDASRA
ncbi:SGNH hydrolase superfamily [Fusarium oxysporum f. sp. vasinfectum]|nr:SGNH hydrolase superfamily [Fusarium oxysporum f. sp. vasinfectum]